MSEEKSASARLEALETECRALSQTLSFVQDAIELSATVGGGFTPASAKYQGMLGTPPPSGGLCGYCRNAIAAVGEKATVFTCAIPELGELAREHQPVRACSKFEGSLPAPEDQRPPAGA